MADLLQALGSDAEVGDITDSTATALLGLVSRVVDAMLVERERT